MSVKNSGGPAFPSGARIEDHSSKGYHIEQAAWMGMSLRDWFAGLALEGMIAGSQGLQITTEEFAKQAYRLADAMLKEREK